jgi:hypothetical protein
MVVQALEPEQVVDARHHFALVERLTDVVVGTDAQAGHATVRVRTCGQQHHRQERVGHHALDQPAAIQAIEPGHDDVEHRQIDVPIARPCQSTVAILGDEHVHAVAL